MQSQKKIVTFGGDSDQDMIYYFCFHLANRRLNQTVRLHAHWHLG